MLSVSHPRLTTSRPPTSPSHVPETSPAHVLDYLQVDPSKPNPAKVGVPPNQQVAHELEDGSDIILLVRWRRPLQGDLDHDEDIDQDNRGRPELGAGFELAEVRHSELDGQLVQPEPGERGRQGSLNAPVKVEGSCGEKRHAT